MHAGTSQVTINSGENSTEVHGVTIGKRKMKTILSKDKWMHFVSSVYLI
jgi:hypothetical protein